MLVVMRDIKVDKIWFLIPGGNTNCNDCAARQNVVQSNSRARLEGAQSTLT